MAEAFGVAGSAVGVVSLGIQVCQGLLQYYSSWKDSHADIATMCNSVQTLVGTLIVLQQALESDALSANANLTQVQISIADCFTGIEELQRKLNKVKEIPGTDRASRIHGQGRRLLYPFRESTLVKLKEIVSETRANLNLAADVLHLQTTVRHGEQLGSVSAGIKDIGAELGSFRKLVVSQYTDEQNQAIIDWLSPLNFFEMQADVLSRRQEGTGQWLFETPQFLAWLSGHEKIIWYYGQPGAGKTVLASAIIDKLEKEISTSKAGLCFLYCSYKERDTQTFQNLVASLIKQLVQCSQNIPDEVRELHDGYYKPQGKRPNERIILEIFTTIVSRFSRIYFVVDALDECNDDNGTRTRLTELLQNQPASVQILCTSRRLGDIQESFAAASHLEILASDADVEVFLKARISKMIRLTGFCKKDEKLRGKIIQRLVDNAKGMFLSAQLHIEYLRRQTTMKQVYKALENLPTEMNVIYEETMERIHNLPPEESKLAIQLLSWVFHAMRPLTVIEAQHAVAIMELEDGENTISQDDLPSETVLITVCGGLATIDHESNNIRLVHYTTQKYFEKHCSQLLPNAEVSLTLACIRYLSLYELRAYYAPKQHKTMGGERKHLDDLIATYPLLDYASQNWASHARGLPEISLQSELMGFVEYWSNPYYVPSSDNEKAAVSPIFTAAEHGLASILLEMLKNGHDVEGRPIDEYRFATTPLLAAVRKGHIEAVKILLAYNADTTIMDSVYEDSRTALHWAALFGNEPIVQVLLAHGVDIEARNELGGTALHEAATNGNTLVVELLLNRGADIDARDNNGDTPLRKASKRGKKSTAELLLDRGADIEALYIY